MHFLEISENSGNSLDRLKALFEMVDRNWVPIENNPLRIMDKSKAEEDSENVFIASWMLKPFEEFGVNGSLSELIDIIERGSTKIKKLIPVLEGEPVKRFLKLKEKWKKGEWSKLKEPPIMFTNDGLVELLFKKGTDLKKEPNHIFDLIHVETAFVYGDVMVVDKFWAEMLKNIHAPFKSAEVFKVGALPDFLSYLNKKWS
jgi:hypothetical protein